MTLKLLAFLLIISFCSFSQSGINVTSVDVSSTQKSLMLNIGLADNIKTSQKAILVSVGQKSNSGLKRFLPVALIRSVKVLGNQSLWIVIKRYSKESIVKNHQYLYVSQDQLLKGRSKLSASASLVVANKDKLTQKVLGKLQSNDSSLISKKNSDKLVVAQSNQDLDVYDKDVELVSLKAWRESFSQKEAKSIYKSQHIESFRDTKDLATFEKTLYSQLKKWNSPDYQSRQLYSDQKRDQFVDGLQNRGIKDSYFIRSAELEKEKSLRYEKFKQKIKGRKDWSSDYSDEELSFLVKEYGIEFEKNKRNTIINYQKDSQIITSFGINLLDNENLNDPDDTVALKYDFQLTYEKFAFKKFKNLSQFTFDASIRRAVDSFTTGKFNATASELSLAAALNWYPFTNPSSVESNIFYFSAFFRYGQSQIDSKGLNASGTYQVYSFPGISAGLKYNFNNLWGLRFSGSFENIILDRIESTGSGALPDRLSYFDGKISIGITRFL